MDIRRELDIVQLNFSKDFDIFILTDKLTKCKLGMCATKKKPETWLNDWAQKVIISGTKTI